MLYGDLNGKEIQKRGDRRICIADSLAYTAETNTEYKATACYALSHFSRVRLCQTPWTVACQAPLSMGFSRQEYWSGLPFPSPGDLPNPETEPASLEVSCIGRRGFTTSAAWEYQKQLYSSKS